MQRPEHMADEMRRACVELEMRHPEARHILLTGVAGREGTSTVACLLAEALAEMLGSRVVIVDANLRTPALHTLLSVPQEDGLRDWEPDATDKTVHQAPALGQLFVMPCGSDNGRTLLTLQHSGRLDKLAETLGRAYDYVIWDVPPLTIHADGRFLLRHVDGVLVVAEGDRTLLEPLTDLYGMLATANTPILGAIMNRSNRYALTFRSQTPSRAPRRLSA